MDWGFSPDAIDEDGVPVDFKCLSAKKHLNVMRDPHKGVGDYYLQLQNQLYIAGSDKAILYYFHPSLPSFRVVMPLDVHIQDGMLMRVKECLETRNMLLEEMGRTGGSYEFEPTARY